MSNYKILKENYQKKNRFWVNISNLFFMSLYWKHHKCFHKWKAISLIPRKSNTKWYKIYIIKKNEGESKNKKIKWEGKQFFFLIKRLDWKEK